jgi:hypothetical protein
MYRQALDQTGISRFQQVHDSFWRRRFPEIIMSYHNYLGWPQLHAMFERLSYRFCPMLEVGYHYLYRQALWHCAPGNVAPETFSPFPVYRLELLAKTRCYPRGVLIII